MKILKSFKGNIGNKKKRKKLFLLAQSITEYAIALAAIAGALLVMQIYLRRGIQGRIKDLADEISPVHYEQGQTSSYFVSNQYGETVSSYNFGNSATYTNEITEREGIENVETEQDEIK